MHLPWFRPRSREDWPPEVRDYALHSKRLPERKTPWSGLRMVVLDAETSGFRPSIDRMLSLSVVPVEGNRIRLPAMRSWTIYQHDIVVNPATLVHGILPSETAKGQSEREVMVELLPLLRNAVLVGHHVGFDARMVSDALRRNFGLPLRNVAVDTAALATMLVEAFHKTGYANQRPPTLEEVCAHFGIAMLERHTAAGDTFTTAQLWLQLAGLLRQRLRREIELRDLPVVRY